MNSYKEIINIATSLAKKYNTTNPFELAESIGVMVKYVSEFKKFPDEELKLRKLPGFYFAIKKTENARDRYAVLDENLDINVLRMVLAHELGHDVLYKGLEDCYFFPEDRMMHNNIRDEYEANNFAAAFLVPESDILDLIYNYQYDANQIAKQLKVDISVVSMRIDQLICCGHKFQSVPRDENFITNKILKTDY